MQVMAAYRRQKFSRALNYPRTMPYAKSCFSASIEAGCFRKVVVSGLAPPDVLNTSGVKEALSTLEIRSSYSLHLARSCQLYQELREDFLFDGAFGLKILTSKKVFSAWLPQNPLALITRCASSSVVVVCQWKVSPVSGCRSGSMAMSKQTSEMSVASRSRTSL